MNGVSGTYLFSPFPQVCKVQTPRGSRSGQRPSMPSAGDVPPTTEDCLEGYNASLVSVCLETRLHLFVKFSAGCSLPRVGGWEKDNSTKRCKGWGGEGGDLAYPYRQVPQWWVRRDQERACWGTAPSQGRQSRVALHFAGLQKEKERQGRYRDAERLGTFSAQQERRCRGTTGKSYIWKAMLTSNRTEVFRSGRCSERNRSTKATPRHGRAPQNQGTGQEKYHID